MAQRAFTSHPLFVRRVTVRRIEEVTPRMRRIVVGGEGLAEGAIDGGVRPAFAAPGFDDHVKLIFAADGDIEAALPRQLPHGIEWTPAEHRVARDYTPRRVDLEAHELDLDFVMHGDGPAAAWAGSAEVGDELCFVGPKSSLRLPRELDWIVLVADETGLPAVGRFLDERPVDAPAHVLLFVEHESAKQTLALRDGDTIAWHTAPAGDAASLEAAVRALPLPPGEGYVWAAAESRALLPVRRYLQRELKIAKDRLNITGYWHAERAHEAAIAASAAGAAAGAAAGRAGEAAGAGAGRAAGVSGGSGAVRGEGGSGGSGLRPGAPAEPLPSGGSHAGVHDAPAVPDPRPWFVVRAALDLGLVDELADGPLALEALAQRVGVAVERLRALLPVLEAYDVMTRHGSILTLGDAGEELLDEHGREDYEGMHASLLLSLAELAPALRSGEPAWRVARGRTLAESAAEDEEVYEEIAEGAARLAFLLDGFVRETLWDGVATCLLAGPGAPAVIGALEDAGRGGVALAVLDEGLPGRMLREAVEHPELVHWGATAADLAVLPLALAHLTDAEAVELLGRVFGFVPRAVVIEAAKPDALSPAARTQHVMQLAGTGAPMRDAAAIDALAAAAGWRREGGFELGWGVEAGVFARG